MTETTTYLLVSEQAYHDYRTDCLEELFNLVAKKINEEPGRCESARVDDRKLPS